MKHIACWIFAPVVVAASLPLHAIVLDCEDHGDGTYTCVEIEAGSATGAPQQNKAATIDPVLIEQAKRECVLREPRVRPGGMAASAARMEAKKTARENYEQCIATRAKELSEASP
ncbi:hypothetical protein [Thiogranum longum]